MTSFSNYEKIQDFKKSGTAIFEGVNYAYVISPYLYDTSLVGRAKKLIFSLFFSTRILKRTVADSSVLLFYSCRHKGRADYDYIPNRLQELLGDCCVYAECGERFSLMQACRTLARFRSSFRGMAGYRNGIWHRIAAALLIAKYRATAGHAFSSILQGKDCLVTFCDAQAPENLLTQIANTAGLFTVTNQHGQYRILDKTNMSADAEAYANFVSHRMLCWGEATQTEFARYGVSPERLVVTGWIKDWNRAGLPRTTATPKGVFGVMLNADTGRESNFALLETAKFIAKKLGLVYLIRLHPWSDPKEYEKLLDEHSQSIGRFDLSTYLSRVDFSLAHMSGAVIEVLHAGAPVYLLDDGRLAKAFQVDGLSHLNSCAVAAAIVSDQSAPTSAQHRLVKLAQWYNDDSQQAIRIRQIILNERGGCASNL